MGAGVHMARPTSTMGVIFARTGIEFAQQLFLKTRSEDRPPPLPLATMGKHFTTAEVDLMHQLHTQGVGAAEIQRRMAKQRGPRGKGGPDLTSVRRALRGRTFKRAKVETRGRPRSLTSINLPSVTTRPSFCGWGFPLGIVAT